MATCVNFWSRQRFAAAREAALVAADEISVISSVNFDCTQC